MKPTPAILAVILLSGITTHAKVTPLAHYNFGRSGNVTYAVAPESLPSSSGDDVLRSVGKPLFYADAPADKALQGEGCVLFKEGAGYAINKALGTSPGNRNQLLEVWVKAVEIPQNDVFHQVLCNGEAGKGCSIGIRQGKWAIDSKESVSLGKAQQNQWVHLAIVVEDGKGIAYQNGEQVATFSTPAEYAPHFSIAASAGGMQESFQGMVYEVRVSTFEKGEFSAGTDLLFNRQSMSEEHVKRLEERKTLIRELESPAPGKEIVQVFPEEKPSCDWLLSPEASSCKLLVRKAKEGGSTRFQLTNGLVSRTFHLGDNIACISYKNLSNGAEYIRAVKPEARLKIDGVWYDVGGLKNQPECSYLLEEWLPEMKSDKQAFQLVSIKTDTPAKRYTWNKKYNAQPAEWPPKGLQVVMTYKPTEEMTHVKGLEVKVHYEIYEGIPVMAKWVEVENASDRDMILNETECEILAVNQDQRDRLHVESDFSFALVNGNIKGSALMHFKGTPQPYQAGESTTLWSVDPDYNTWASQNQAEDAFLDFPHRNMLISRLPVGPDTAVAKNRPFQSFVTFELLQDSDDRERKSLAHRRMYRVLAPQVTESLLTGGITSNDPAKLKAFIDQMAELGMERLDIMAWVGIQHDNLNPDYVNFWKDIAIYARERGIIIGGYELQIASRGRGKQVDCVNPETGKPGSLFGQSVCVASAWKDSYFPKMWEFFDKTGLKSYNMDGPYHGDICASTKHPHHRGMNDSQWEQWKAYVDILHELQRRDVFIPIPDWYFLNGQCTTGMGYREASANLSPQQQLLLGRQYIYDGTWHKLPTMGWMTLQLVGFYTNDPRVGLEPLKDNLSRYEQQLIQYLASGCMLTIRGNRLYDTPETKAMVKKWIDWYKDHRAILTSEIIHISRPTGRDLDCIMHANPFLEEKGLVVVFNPTNRDITQTLTLPLYYTGLKGQATVTDETGTSRPFEMNDACEIQIPVTLTPQGTAWFVIKK